MHKSILRLHSSALVVGTPIHVAVMGSHQGPVGAFLGFLLGTTIGAIAGTAFIVGSAYSGVAQTAVGIIRTPRYLIAVGSNEDWDTDMEEWVHYNLIEDAKHTLLIKEKHIRAALDGTEKIGTAGSVRTKTTVKEREYYDILGVEPNATQGQIKKAYHGKARQLHPDKNRDDPEANDKFQKLGQAFAVLSDDQLRAAYDNDGKEAVNNRPADAGAMFTMVFGSEDFEPIVGDLWISQFISVFTGSFPDNHTDPNKKQRRREVQCALNLVAKLKVYTDGDEEGFKKKVTEEATALAETPLGAALLRLVGSVYTDRASSEMNTVQGLCIAVQQSGITIGDVCSLAQKVDLCSNMNKYCTHFTQHDKTLYFMMGQKLGIE